MDKFLIVIIRFVINAAVRIINTAGTIKKESDIFVFIKVGKGGNIINHLGKLVNTWTGILQNQIHGGHGTDQNRTAFHAVNDILNGRSGMIGVGFQVFLQHKQIPCTEQNADNHIYGGQARSRQQKGSAKVAGFQNVFELQGRE